MDLFIRQLRVNYMSCLYAYKNSICARETLFNMYKLVDSTIDKSSINDLTLLEIVIDSYNEYVAKYEDDTNSNFIPNNKKIKNIIIGRKIKITDETMERSANYLDKNHNIFENKKGRISF